jgi:hypothetical protein
VSNLETVAGVGENEALKRTIARLNPSEHALVGPGDDSAVISAPDGKFVVTTKRPSGAAITAESSPGPTSACSDGFNRAMVRLSASFSPTWATVSRFDTLLAYSR